MRKEAEKKKWEDIFVAKQISFFEGKVLDAGYIETFEQFKSYQGELYGIDIQEIPKPDWYVETKKVNLNVEKIPYPDYFFDTVYIGDILLHVTNPLRFLYECNRVLKMGGKLLMFIENPYFYWTIIITVFRDYFDFSSDQHFYSLNRNNVRTLVRKSGFTLKKEVGLGFTVVKLHWQFKCFNWPSLAGYIYYVSEKTLHQPSQEITVENQGRNKRKVLADFG